MGQVSNLIGAQGAAAAGVLGPAQHPRFEEGAIDDQLTAALEDIEQAHLALGPVELVLPVDSLPRHPPAVGGQRVTGAGQGLLLHEEPLVRSLPFLPRHDRGCDHREMPPKTRLSLPMHTARIPPVDPAAATIAAVLAMHAGHISSSSLLGNWL